jgi:hypothetical protein
MYLMYMKELVYAEVLLCLKIRGKSFDMKLFLYRPGEQGIPMGIGWKQHQYSCILQTYVVINEYKASDRPGS